MNISFPKFSLARFQGIFDSPSQYAKGFGISIQNIAKVALPFLVVNYAVDNGLKILLNSGEENQFISGENKRRLNNVIPFITTICGTAASVYAIKKYPLKALSAWQANAMAVTFLITALFKAPEGHELLTKGQIFLLAASAGSVVLHYGPGLASHAASLASRVRALIKF